MSELTEMSQLSEKLRGASQETPYLFDLCEEAADAIDRMARNKMDKKNAQDAVDLIFQDLRDRRMLKWIFSEYPILIGQLNGEEFRSLDEQVLTEIRSSWVDILLQTPSSKSQKDGAK